MSELWPHQKTFVYEYVKGRTGTMAAHSMGCGKSFESVYVADKMDAKRVLIMCPKSVIDVWPKEFGKHAKRDYEFCLLKKGSVAKKTELLERKLAEAKLKGTNLVCVVNYESAWRPPLGPIYQKNRIRDYGTLLGTKWDLIICDESHRIKNPTSKIGWFTYQFAKFNNGRKRICLTGTPMPASPLDVYSQFRFMDPKIFGAKGIHSYSQFKRRYAVIQKFDNFEKVVGFQNEDELTEVFFSRAHRVMLRDVRPDLPPVQHEYRTFNLPPKTMGIYRRLKEDFIAWYETDGQVASVTANIVLTRLLRLNQLTGGYLQPDDVEPGAGQFIDRSKLNVLEDLFLDISLDEPLVVFALFKPEMDKIAELAEKCGRPCAHLRGGQNQLAEWQAGDFNVLVAQMRAGSVGIDLTRACYTIYYSVGYSLGDFIQSLARTDRPGQTRDGTYYHLVAEDTVDVDIYRALEAKQKDVDKILAPSGDLSTGIITNITGGTKHAA